MARGPEGGFVFEVQSEKGEQGGCSGSGWPLASEEEELVT